VEGETNPERREERLEDTYWRIADGADILINNEADERCSFFEG